MFDRPGRRRFVPHSSPEELVWPKTLKGLKESENAIWVRWNRLLPDPYFLCRSEVFQYFAAPKFQMLRLAGAQLVRFHFPFANKGMIAANCALSDHEFPVGGSPGQHHREIFRVANSFELVVESR